MLKRLFSFSLVLMLGLMMVFLFISCGDMDDNDPGIANPAPRELPDGKGHASDHILVKFKPATDVLATNAALGVNTLEVIPKINVHILGIPQNSTVEDTLQSLSRNPNVEYAEPDFIAYADLTPNDPKFSQQWGLTKIQAPAAWDITSGSNSVKIAILDTGIDADHEDLKTKIVKTKNFTSNRSSDDAYGHGTHVAGIAAAITNNKIGVAGTGFNSGLMNGKVLGDNGSGNYSWVANGIIWAADNGAKVINMSLSGSSSSTTLENAVNYAWSKGVVIVAAAGNDGSTNLVYPAAYSNCIAVAATDSSDSIASFSNRGGDWVDVAGPGVNIYSTMPNHKSKIGSKNYGSLSGTSMSTPFVSGTAALIWAITNYGTSNANVRDRLESKADPISGTGIGANWEHGRINVLKSVGP
jgi:thermitase